MNNNRWKKTRRYSYIGMHSSCNFAYAMQYKLSFKILYDSNESVDLIALPMLYSMRHYLELILKYNIEYFHKFSGSRSMVDKNVHTLSSLSNAFKEHWAITKKKFSIDCDDKELLENLTQLVDKLSCIDSNAVSFRYSHDRDKNKNFDMIKTIDIYQINDLLEKSTVLLDHSIDLFEYKKGLMNGATSNDELLK